MMAIATDRHEQTGTKAAAVLASLFFFLAIGTWGLPAATLAAGADLRQAPLPVTGQQSAPGRPPVAVRPAPERQQLAARKPAKIKLHRNAKGEYSWEMSGENVEEILRIDRRLRKAFEGQEEAGGK